jgi:hypothetical protein
MICFRDTTYCASPDCINECGRQMDDDTKRAAANSGMPLSFSYFCGQHDDTNMGDDIKRILNHATTE